MIPEVDTGFQLFFYEVLQGFCIQTADAHTSLDDGWDVAIADGDLFHMETSFVVSYAVKSMILLWWGKSR